VDRGFSRDIYSASDEAFNPWAEISRLLIFGGTRSATALFRAPFLKSSAAQGKPRLVAHLASARLPVERSAPQRPAKWRRAQGSPDISWVFVVFDGKIPQSQTRGHDAGEIHCRRTEPVERLC
jgi:hypothetical protein